MTSRTASNGAAVSVDVLPVKELFEGKTVWEGVVHVFDLEGHPKATRAYAWSSPIEGSNRRRFYAVLHLGGIRSPLDAVRAAIVAENNGKRRDEARIISHDIDRASGCFSHRQRGGRVVGCLFPDWQPGNLLRPSPSLRDLAGRHKGGRAHFYAPSGGAVYVYCRFEGVAA
jgi:hypothetical protein